jgi:uncharacterized integral membrane protein
MSTKIRRKIGKNMKRLLLIITAIVFSILLFILLRTLLIKNTTEVEIEKYKYQLEKEINYEVYLAENKVYDDNVLGEDMFYPKKLIKDIKINYNLQYLGSSEVPIHVEYQILAKVNGYNIDDTDKYNIWTKTFPLTEVKTDEITDLNYSLNQSTTASLYDYIRFAEEAAEVTGVVLSNEVLFCLVGRITADTSYGIVDIPLDMTVSSSFNNVLKFTKNGIDIATETFNEKIMKELPVNKTVVVVFSVLIIITLLAFIYLLLFTCDYEFKDILLNEVNKIKKDYGSRMVALQSEVLKLHNYQYIVHSMKDLVKVSDELQKPILFQIDENDIVKDYKFYVLRGDELYLYNVLDSMIVSGLK